ncbi:MAG: hypothetical protein NTY32_10270 [Bacteroidia bacterium]|nr:hypothetical protein [Bacteroidia bacterium]
MKFFFALFAILVLSISTTQAVETVVPFTTTGAQTWLCPEGVTSIIVECWGGGGAGGGSKYLTGGTKIAMGGGGSGGGYAKKVIAVSPGTTYNLYVGLGGIGIVPASDDATAPGGEASYFIDNSTVKANGGIGGKGKVLNNSAATANLWGTGGTFISTGQVGVLLYSGGNGGTATSVTNNSGSGGGSAGTGSNGNNGSDVRVATAAVTGGGAGGQGVNAISLNYPGTQPGGGGGGSRSNSSGTTQKGGDGGNGQITITYSLDPAVYATPTSLSGFAYMVGTGPSTSQSVSLTGSNLTGFTDNLTVTAPTNFEVSMDNTTFGGSALVPFTSATLNATTIYVRLKAGLSGGNYTAENVVITGGGLATAYNIACNGAVSGTYSWNGGVSTDWQVAGNWTPSRTAAAGDILQVNAGGSVTIINVPAAQTIAQLLLSNNTALELQAAANAVVTIAGGSGADLAVPAGSSLTLGGTTSTLKIALATGTTGTVGGNVAFVGSDAAFGLNHQITATDVGAITFANGSVMTAGTNFTSIPFGSTPNGAVVFESGSSYIHASGGAPSGGGNNVNVVTFNSGSLYKFTGLVGGTAPAAVTVKPPIATKTYANYEIAATTTISNSNPSGDVSFENMVINGTAFSISGNTGGAKSIIKGNVTIGTGGGLTFGNAAAVSPVVFNGTLPQTITLTGTGFFTIGTGSVMSVDNDLTLDGDITLNGTVNVASGKTLTIASGKTLTLPTGAILNLAAGAKLTNNGTISNSGTITISSDATNTSTVIGSGTISGTTNVNQWLTSGRSWYVSNPVGVVARTVTSGTITVYKFDESLVTDPAGTTGWGLTTDPLLVGRGYFANVSIDGNAKFTGTLNTGNLDINLTRREAANTNFSGFNLIGNPYPSYLDWSAVCAYTTDGDVTHPNQDIMPTTTMWYRTKATGSWGFVTVNGAGVTSPMGVATKFIPPMQAFWVRAKTTAGGTLKLTNAMRFHTDAVNNPSPNLLRASAVNASALQLVRLQVSNGTRTDEAVLYFSPNAANGFDRYDAPKMSNADPLIPEICTVVNGEQITINAMNSIPLDTPFGLKFVAGSATSFSITANEVSNLPEGVKLILKDNVTLAETDLTDGTSTYSFNPETTNTDRFSIIFRSPGSTTNVKDTRINGLMVYSTSNTSIEVICKDQKLIGSLISVYNSVGQKIVSQKLTTSNMHIQAAFAPGIYMVRTNGLTTRVVLMYCPPQIACVTLDNEISLALESNPPINPFEVNSIAPEFFPMINEHFIGF